MSEALDNTLVFVIGLTCLVLGVASLLGLTISDRVFKGLILLVASYIVAQFVQLGEHIDGQT